MKSLGTDHAAGMSYIGIWAGRSCEASRPGAFPTALRSNEILHPGRCGQLTCQEQADARHERNRHAELGRRARPFREGASRTRPSPSLALSQEGEETKSLLERHVRRHAN